VISHPLVSRSISSAQRRVEGRNFEIRKHLKEYDDVMNIQRTHIYGLRQRILRGENLKDELLEQLAMYIENVIFKNTANSKFPEEWNLKELYNEIMMTTGCTYRVPDAELESKTQESMFDELWGEVKKRYEEKEARFGEQVMRNFERGVFLMVIDNLWKDHLYFMDHLKGGVQYTAFGQKNPLYEYQREGRKAFEELCLTIAREVTSYLFRLEFVKQEDRMGLERARTLHSEFETFASAGPAPAPAARPANPSELITSRQQAAPATQGARQPVHAVKTAGRNDPCPCGSGKKFKQCHGREA
jgi:preprotein translocase subunit SecA